MFTVAGRPSLEVARALAAEQVAVWHGNYYAVELARHLGLEPDGAVRAGAVAYTDEDDVRRLVEAVARPEAMAYPGLPPPPPPPPPRPRPWPRGPAPARPAPHVACLWLRDPEPAPHAHRIVPDACADVVWVQGERLVVAGPQTEAVVSEIPAGAAALGVRFRIGAAGSALGVPARELLDRTVALDDLWGIGARRLAERLDAAATPEEALAVFTAAIERRLPPPDALDTLVCTAALRAAHPRAAVEMLGDGLGVGERQLRRRFLDAVGYGPKTLQRVLRFQRFLGLARAPGADAGADLAGPAFAAGYAAQAPPPRECRRPAGLPPAALLATGAGPVGEPLV